MYSSRGHHKGRGGKDSSQSKKPRSELKTKEQIISERTKQERIKNRMQGNKPMKRGGDSDTAGNSHLHNKKQHSSHSPTQKSQSRAPRQRAKSSPMEKSEATSRAEEVVVVAAVVAAVVVEVDEVAAVVVVEVAVVAAVVVVVAVEVEEDGAETTTNKKPTIGNNNLTSVDNKDTKEFILRNKNKLTMKHQPLVVVFSFVRQIHFEKKQQVPKEREQIPTALLIELQVTSREYGCLTFVSPCFDEQRT